MDWYKMAEGEVDWFGYGGSPKTQLEFAGQAMSVSPGFGCVLVLQPSTTLPHQLKVIIGHGKCMIVRASRLV